MFRFFNSCFVFLLIILFAKWLISPEATELAKQILIKILTIISNLLATVQLP